MAVSVALLQSIVPNSIDVTQQEFIADGSLTLSGNYGTGSSHGDTVNLSQLGIASDQVPNRVEVFEQPAAGTAATGYVFVFCPGTTQANGVLCILGTGAAAGGGGQEITEGSAYSGFSPSLNGLVLRFRAWFPKFV